MLDRARVVAPLPTTYQYFNRRLSELLFVQEDRLLRDLVATHGAMKWAHIAKVITKLAPRAGSFDVIASGYASLYNLTC